VPERINVTRKERNGLLRFGRDLGAAVHQIVTIVSPAFSSVVPEKTGKGSAVRGWPTTAAEIREMILQMAKENSWGYTRIMGLPPSRNTVK